MPIPCSPERLPSNFNTKSKLPQSTGLRIISLARALAEYPRLFLPLCCATVDAGEKMGRLAQALTMLADFIERRQQVRQQILQAAIYPSVIALIAIAIVSFLLAYVTGTKETGREGGRRRNTIIKNH